MSTRQEERAEVAVYESLHRSWYFDKGGLINIRFFSVAYFLLFTFFGYWVLHPHDWISHFSHWILLMTTLSSILNAMGAQEMAKRKGRNINLLSIAYKIYIFTLISNLAYSTYFWGFIWHKELEGYQDVLSTIFVFLVHVLPLFYQIFNIVFTKLIVKDNIFKELIGFTAVYLATNLLYSKLSGHVYKHLSWSDFTTVTSVLIFEFYVAAIYFILVQLTAHRKSI